MADTREPARNPAKSLEPALGATPLRAPPHEYGADAGGMPEGPMPEPTRRRFLAAALPATFLANPAHASPGAEPSLADELRAALDAKSALSVVRSVRAVLRARGLA
jgi:hypothetical protein